MDKLQKIRVFIDHEAQKKPLTAKMRQSGRWTDLELLSLFPNNLLKRKGLPMQRDKNRRLSVQRVANNWTLFEIIEECVEELVGTYIDKPYFNEFVDVKNVAWEDNQLRILDVNHVDCVWLDMPHSSRAYKTNFQMVSRCQTRK